MKKELSIRRLFIDVFRFIGRNSGLLGCLAFLSFLGSYAAFWLGSSRGFLFFALYGCFIYFFYYLFIVLYFGKKPIFTAERFINSFVKLLIILAFSFFVLILCKIGLNITHYLARGLIIFPDLYDVLRNIYQAFMLSSVRPIVMYLSVLVLLSFSFFIPGFAWMSVLEDQSGSVVEAYANVRGNYFKTVYVFVLIYGILPLLIGSAAIVLPRTLMAAIYAFQTVFQLVIYLHLYAFFYSENK